MDNPEPQAVQGQDGQALPLGARWRRLGAAYRYANRASHHVLGFTVKLVLFIYFALAVLFLVLRYAVLPNIDLYKGDIEAAAGRALGSRVTIAQLSASWQGIHPALHLADVRLIDPHGRQVLALPDVAATLSWWSLAAFEPRLHTLEVSRPQLDVRRGADGVLTVAGVRLDPSRRDDGSGADWLLRQREIVIREGRVDWTDELRGRPTLALDGVTMALLNRFGGGHRFALRATPPRALGGQLDVRARFRHRFGERPSDVARWKGELYADLRDADLAAWKHHVEMPFELASGRGSVRAWLNFDHARVAGFTADLALADVNARLGTALAPLELAQVRGRLAAREDMLPGTDLGKPTFGAHGHTVSLTDFSVTTRDGRLLPPATLEQSWRPARPGRAEQGELKARRLDIGALSALAGYLPLPPQQRQMLADYAPRGRVLDLAAEWEGRYPALRSFRVRGEVAGLALDARPARAAQPARAGQPALPARPATPGFQNLSGSIDATERGGSVKVDAQAAVLLLPAWFAEPMLPLDRLALKARWTHDAGRQLLVEVDNLQFAQGALSGQLAGRHVLPLASGIGAGSGPGVADFTGRIDGLALGEIWRFLPLATPGGLRDWLSGALQGGMLRDATLRLRGDLAHFPFRASIASERARGEFRVAGRLDDARLDYVPGQRRFDGSPLWPLAENIDGRIEFDRARMEIRGDRLRSMGVTLSKVKAVIPDLGAGERKMLEIDGMAAGTLQEFLNYVAASPVPEWIGHFTDDTRASGNARLSLKLRMPLAHLADTKVTGSLQLLGNEISLFPELPPLQAALGRIDFWEHGVNLNGVSASFLGGPLALSGGTQKDGSIAIRLGGTLSADGMRRAAPAPALQRLGARLSGSTPYAGAVTVRDGRRSVTLESSLAGLGLELPAPLNKPQATTLPLRFTLVGEPTVDGLARDEIRIALGQEVAARYLREKQGRGPWLVRRGGIGVKVPAPLPDSGTAIHVDMRALNVDAWIAAGKEIAGAGGAPGSAAAPTGAGAEAAQYVLPDLIAGRVAELTVGERRLADVVLGATRLKDTWQASLNSRQVSGYVTWAASGSGQGLGKVTARLASLVIPESSEDDVKHLLESSQGATATIPSLDIVAEHFQVFDKRLGRLELQASNVQALAGREWRISRLNLHNPEGQLTANGRWLTKDGKSNTSLNFKLDIDDAGKLLDRLGFPETLRRGTGKMSGDISWSGLPYALDIPSLSGQIEMNVESGQFLKQDPGAAKLLGVLSLQALPRLLKLDFHDVFSQGLAFDGISANALIQRGVLRTDNLKMHGVAATILMDGSADIANETTNLRVVVIPEFNLGTGPLVYGLAVNPVIGLGSFLAQLFLRAPVMKALTYQMNISGPWKSPTVVKLDHPQPAPAAARVNARKE
ncbi:YhdP family protein [Massilia sp. H6]|uniref:YhdP family protein n=1 Tax=Massilia sp. H6 TaxID=2970464 RepID=UPI00216A88D1|nr:YhdP family protein [Massilia sp. H6]UVW29679.1 YhdP family protein [Massilia sp. H6]